VLEVDTSDDLVLEEIVDRVAGDNGKQASLQGELLRVCRDVSSRDVVHGLPHLLLWCCTMAGGWTKPAG
jgi:hypothetical protein